MKFVYCQGIEKLEGKEENRALAKRLVSENLLNRASVQNCCFVFSLNLLSQEMQQQLQIISDRATAELAEIVDSPPIHPLAVIGQTGGHILLVRFLIEELHALRERREPIAVTVFEVVENIHTKNKYFRRIR